MGESIRDKLEGLRETIRRHDTLYYVENKPTLSDERYDRLFAQLKELEESHPELVTADSPTQRVGGEPLKGFVTVRHGAAMLSIDNTYSADELRQFDQRVGKLLGGQTYRYVVEPKIDGVAVSVRYEKGELVLGATRGNGREGDDVTGNVRTVRSIPLRLAGHAWANGPPYKETKGGKSTAVQVPEVLEVRGEVFMPLGAFKQVNRRRAKANEEPFANPRNATAGSLKMLDSRIVAQRQLHFLAYGVGQVEPADFADSHAEMLEKLKGLSLPVNPHYEVAEDIDAVIRICEHWQGRKEKLDYQIDGMVIKVDNLSQQRELGQTSRSGRWCIAYKFAAQRAETVVEGIRVQVGKTGALTPVADLTPVSLAGTTVSRASLHNFDELERKDVRVGDRVLVEKAGEIIPQVVEVIKSKRPKGSQAFKRPKQCPVCRGAVAKDEGGVSLRCINPNCEAQLVERIRYFAGRNQMDITGLGVAVIEQLVERKLVGGIADLYRLTVEKVSELERMAAKSAQNLIEAIEASKGRPLANVLAGLGIMHVGNTAGRVLAEALGSMAELMDVSVEALEEIDEIGPVMAQSVYEFFHNDQGRRLMEDFLELGLEMAGPARKAASEGVLSGQTVVVTGSIEGYSRQAMEDLIRRHGGKASGSVSQKTHLVVVGEKPGSKAAKANELGVQTMEADRFLKWMGEA